MKRRMIRRPRRESLCAELGEDDGIDPRRFFKNEDAGDDRKTQQLCKQVFRTLVLVLGGECRDAVLHEVEIQSVLPAPDSSRLLVTVEFGGSLRARTPEDILGRLQAVQPFLRCEVAAAICRKRAPDLVFQVLPRNEARP